MGSNYKLSTEIASNAIASSIETQPAPTVSVCLPVYNGASYLQESVASILTQTFRDLELLISDNASSDRTADICLHVAALDRRVRYFRSLKNRGSAWNHNRPLAFARGRYVSWIGHDDVVNRDYIGRCVDELERDPAAVLCHSYQERIDESGNQVAAPRIPNEGASTSPSERFRKLLHFGWCEPIYGLMRTDVVRCTALHGAYARADHVLVAEMGLRGRFKLIPDFLFCRRVHPMATTVRYKELRLRNLVEDPSKVGKITFPTWRISTELLSAIVRARLPWKERRRCYQHLLRWIWTNREEMCDDVRDGLVLELKRRIPAGAFERLRDTKRHILRQTHQRVWPTRSSHAE